MLALDPRDHPADRGPGLSTVLPVAGLALQDVKNLFAGMALQTERRSRSATGRWSTANRCRSSNVLALTHLRERRARPLEPNAGWSPSGW
jgi:hypothetical protein